MKLLKNTEATEVVAQELPKINVDTDPSRHARLGWLIVLLGFGGFLLWASFAPLDKGVPASGTVTVSSNRKVVQHQTGGTIEDILVKEGEVVKAGQPLVRMNDVAAKSNAEIARVQYFNARAVEARLIAERDGKKSIAFPPELESAKTDARVANNISLQAQLFSSRQAALQSDLAATDETIAGLKAQVRGLQEALDSQKQQQQFLKEQLEGMRDLAREGYVARNRLLDLERTYAQVNGGMSENIGNIGRAQRQIAELTLRRTLRQQEYQKEVRSQLSEVQKEAEALANRLKSLDFDLENAIVRAPVDGVVVGLNVFTRGGVIPGGFRMMDLVPADDPLVVEAQVPVNLIDKVHPDLKVELIFAAFNQNETPHIPGVVTQVSADRLVDERTGMPYYKIQAQVTPEGKKLLKDLQVRPGMPVELFVKTGERTMMSYLLKPIFDRATTALTEE
ncbi:MAG TPA: HlyD family type I secretion periplasmic adaptor subunit [Noviherbaspirillum sp.]|uniref:HlyD family type I secretion periplasmic adaptor subunit n=1 Tax=Noviherbaspirillum sp. TaxID=1926288 RepID=UPI002D37243D|nr:HlyD family type I secretion periplasmic adaptor subunit [Noviherbaspirillum sp.]HYD94944.1 HlyD family type I secretion periplasmic adaptor subunit [Noviherbaspirillum sp.]